METYKVSLDAVNFSFSKRMSQNEFGVFISTLQKNTKMKKLKLLNADLDDNLVEEILSMLKNKKMEKISFVGNSVNHLFPNR